MAWIVLVLSGILEAVWAGALSASEGLSKPVPSIVFLIALVLSMVGLGYAMRTLPVGTAYAVWVGIGAVLTVAYGMATKVEPVSALRVLLVLGLIGCIVGLKMTSPSKSSELDILPGPRQGGAKVAITDLKVGKVDELRDDRHKIEEYRRIMTPVISGDLAALDELAETQAGFPTGQDPWLEQHWLSNAIGCSTPKVVRWMLENGASPVFPYDDGYGPLHSALERDETVRYEMMAILIEFGADVNAHGVNDYTPVHMAAALNDLEAHSYPPCCPRRLLGAHKHRLLPYAS